MNERAERYMQQMEDVVRNSDHHLYPVEGPLTEWQEKVMATYGRVLDEEFYEDHAGEWRDLEGMGYVFAWPELNFEGNDFTGRYEVSHVAAPMYAVRARIESANDYVEQSKT